ncbi:MAG: hypothetical protein ACLFP1_00260 [Candidatus Goldiibacteriota bacterium]
MKENFLEKKLEFLEEMLKNARKQKELLEQRKITETVSLDREKNRMLAELSGIDRQMEGVDHKDEKNAALMKQINRLFEELMRQEKENEKIISVLIDERSIDFIKSYKQFDKGGSGL